MGKAPFFQNLEEQKGKENEKYLKACCKGSVQKKSQINPPEKESVIFESYAGREKPKPPGPS